MTNPVNNPSAAEPYEAFITATLDKLRSELTKAGAETFTVDEVITHAEFALHTTRMLFNGPSVGTMLRNATTNATATRIVNKRGIPVWMVTASGVSGQQPGTYEVEESILTPDADWKCVYNPDTAGA